MTTGIRPMPSSLTLDGRAEDRRDGVITLTLCTWEPRLRKFQQIPQSHMAKGENDIVDTPLLLE